MPASPLPIPAAAQAARDRAAHDLSTAVLSLAAAVTAAHTGERILAAVDPGTDEAATAARLLRLSYLAEAAAIAADLAAEHRADLDGND